MKNMEVLTVNVSSLGEFDGVDLTGISEKARAIAEKQEKEYRENVGEENYAAESLECRVERKLSNEIAAGFALALQQEHKTEALREKQKEIERAKKDLKEINVEKGLEMSAGDKALLEALNAYEQAEADTQQQLHNFVKMF